MSVYNGAEFLRESVESILSQTYTNFEFVIVNDGSTDQTSKILSEYEDRRILCIDNGKNLGLAKSLNIGIRHANGKYIIRMDSDDVALKERIDVLVDFMEKNPTIDFAGSQAFYLEKYNKTKNVFKVPLTSNKIKSKVLTNPPFIHPSVIIRKESIRSIENLYDPRFLNAQDYDLWERLIFENRLKPANIKLPLLYYRVHELSISNSVNSKQRYFATKVRRRILKRFGISGNINLEVYNKFVYGGDLQRYSCMRLAHVLGQMYNVNRTKFLIPVWSIKHVPFYKYGIWGIKLFYVSGNNRLFSVFKQLTFILKSLLSFRCQ